MQVGIGLESIVTFQSGHSPATYPVFDLNSKNSKAGG
jgi:hypothetical protein